MTEKPRFLINDHKDAEVSTHLPDRGAKKE